jgi:hypothetical protein
MMIFRLARRLSLIALALMSLLVVLSASTDEAFATCSGSLISVKILTPTAVGVGMVLEVTVKNTGIQPWLGRDWGSFDLWVPSWIIVIRDLSWLPGKSYEYYQYRDVGGYATDSKTVLMGADVPSPSSEGNYSFLVDTYCSDGPPNVFYPRMDNSPKSVNFTLVPQPPVLSLSTASLKQSCEHGQDASSQSFEVWNSGQGTLTYGVNEYVTWLSVSPGSGSSTGEHDVINVNYHTSGLSPGTYSTNISVGVSWLDEQYITVTLRVKARGGTPWIGLLLDGDE